MSKTILTAEVVSQTKISEDIFSMILKAKPIAEEAHSGQFINLYSKDASKLLPRPISICDVNKQKGTIRIVYRVAGGGTLEFSKLRAQDTVDVMGPLGNGYNLEGENPILMGGGIGIPPMLQLAKELSQKGLKKQQIHVVLGFRDSSFLVDDFAKFATVHISSDTGAVGMKGNALDCVIEEELFGDMIYACGPTPMLRAIKKYAYQNDIPAQLSLEERMACGIGACLACVTKTAEVDEHFGTNTRRVCKDGPVFYAEEVEL